ncbi:uncharacterized protein LOC126902197 [Daktulosphaira vitifoliae]|uniref:uncharacterized protein LOC126902197 n=1 Tax=Daktulosphaira vitifoliae TaxID=58002 RepID=UPI0021AA0A8D|nr:uncharacterized protein LOC126902197 [Daktulosphaira vitifoliae]
MGSHITPIIFLTPLNWSYVPNELYHQLYMKWYTVYMIDINQLTKAGSNYGYDPCQKPKKTLEVSPFFMTFFIDSQTAVNKMIGLKHSWIWNSDAIYIMVVKILDKSIRNLVSSIWSNEFIHKIIIITPYSVKLYDPLDGNKFKYISLKSLYKVPKIFRQRTSNLQQKPLRVLLNIRPPTVIAMDDGSYGGIDGKFVNLLAVKMNASLILSSEKLFAKIVYGKLILKNGSNHGTLASIIDRRTDLIGNGHFLKDYGCHVSELTRHITSDVVCMLVPKSGIIPPMITVLRSFQNEVWVMLFITYIITFLMYYAKAAMDIDHFKLSGCSLGLEIYKMFIGAPTNRRFACSGQKILTSFCLLFTLVVLNAFQGSLVTFLNTPMHYPDVNTFSELEKSDLPIRTFSLSFKEILNSDPNLRNLAPRVKEWKSKYALKNSDGHHVDFQRINYQHVGHFKDVFYAGNKTKPRFLHKMKECLISYFISYMIHRHSPYKKRIDTIISWVDQAGLVVKWNDEVTKYIFDEYRPTILNDNEKSKVFDIKDVEVAFTVLWVGLLFSSLVFIIEIFLHKISKKKSPPSFIFIL